MRMTVQSDCHELASILFRVPSVGVCNLKYKAWENS